MKPLGYVIVTMLYLVALSPLIAWGIRKVIAWFRSMKPRILRVPNCHGVVMVSGKRARVDLSNFTQVTPWCWRKKA